MKRAQILNLFVLGAVLAIGATGCKRSPEHVTYIPGSQTGGPGGGLQPSGPEGLDGTEGGVPLDGMDGTTGQVVGADDVVQQPNRQLIEGMVPDPTFFEEQTVYFEFDRASLQPEELPKVEAVASYLQNNPETMLQVQGHCDERGTEEYNRALGERRALAVREALINLGVDAGRVFTISYGEDVPAVEGHDDYAWSRNRRGEFVLLRPQG